jgi:Protein of unknown function (DUF3551)
VNPDNRIPGTPSGKQGWCAGLVLGVAIALTLAGAPAPAQAQWCASVQGPDGGFVSCGYANWQQCRAALSGQGGICHRDPAAGKNHVRRTCPGCAAARSVAK